MQAQPTINTQRLTNYLEQEVGLDVSAVNMDALLQNLFSKSVPGNRFEDIAAAAAASIAVHETHFLRHNHHFQWLTSHWLPQKIAEGATHLRILSAGCSTGEEPYSLAAQLQQAARCYALELTIDACDINKQSLQTAAQGKYGLWSLRGVDTKAESNWLDVRSRTVYVREPYKSQVNFFHHNLNHPLTHDEHYDLILCRNVLIYMHPKAVATIYQNLRRALKDNGVLIPGPSDPNPSPDNTLYLQWQHDIRSYRPCPVAANQSLIQESDQSTLFNADANKAPSALMPEKITTKETSTSNTVYSSDDASSAEQSLLISHISISSMIKNGAYDNARNALLSNIACDPFDVRSYTMLATLAFDMNDMHTATDMARKASFLEPESAYTVYLNANIKSCNGDQESAIKELSWAKRLLEQQPPDQRIKYCEDIKCQQLLDVINSRLSLR